MSADNPETSTESNNNPFNQVGLTALLISLSNFIIIDTGWRSVSTLLAPFVSYGVIHVVTTSRRKGKIKKACLAIDNNLARLRATNQDPNLPAFEREENEREIVRLAQLRTNTELQQYDIR